MKHIAATYPKKPTACNCLNVRRASRAITQFYDKVLAPSGLSVAQMALLRQVDRQNSMTISDLAKRMRIDRTTLNRNMKPLMDGELIQVKAGRDSRTKLVCITPSGAAAAATALDLWQEAQHSLHDYLGDDDLNKLTELLGKLEALVP